MKDLASTSITKVSGDIPSLSKIILKLSDQSSDTEYTEQAVVQFDRKKGEVEKLAGTRTWFAALFSSKKPVEYYQVDTYQNATVPFEQVYKIVHPDYAEMEIVLSFKISARPGSETLLVQELAKRDSPEVNLANKLHDWITKIISAEIITLFSNFGNFTSLFKKSLTSYAAGSGLNLDVDTTYKGGIPPKETIRPSAKDIRVQPKGYNDYLVLSYDAVLAPDKLLQSGILVALGLRNRNEFQDMLTNWMQEYIREAVTYNDIIGALHFKVRTSLMEYWNTRLRKENKGWIVAELVLHSEDVKPSGFKIERLEIEVALRNAKVPLINTILLNLEDAERFKNSRVADIQTWIKEKLQQTAHNVLSQYSYAELVSQFEELGRIIKSNLDRQAVLIGYRVEYLLTSELVDKAKLNFQFHFHDEEQVFQTTLNEKINLDVNVSGSINSLNHSLWISRLTPETDLVHEMKKDVLRVVRQLLLRTNADDFYTKFSEKVEPLLISEIKQLLTEQFNVHSGVYIFAQVGISDIRQKIIELQKGQHIAEIKCFGDTASFRVCFSVMSVDPSRWTIFASRSYNTADEIKQAIAERIRIFVENAVHVFVPGVNEIRDARIFEIVNRFARESDKVVREKLGLIIDVIDVEQVSNRLADIATERALVSAESKIKKLMDAIIKTEAEIIDAQDRGDEGWEIEDLEEKLEKLQKRLDNERFKNNQLTFKSSTSNFGKLLNGTGTVDGNSEAEDNDDEGK